MGKYSPYAFMSDAETAEIRRCLCREEKIYNKGDIIMRFTEKAQELALMEKGLAYLVCTDINGQKSILDYYEVGDVFGKRFLPESDRNIYYIQAKEPCTISTIDYDRLLSRCENNCGKHLILLNNLLDSAMRKSQIHIVILSRRSTQDKLMTFFMYLRDQSDSDKFTLPLSLSDLADYLAVDRSAMMREIKKLNESGAIRSDGNVIRIKKDEYGL